MSTEVVTTPESQSQTPDLLIVLGKNIGIRSSPDDIRSRPDHLSNESRMSVVAAGLLYQPGMHFAFSGGHTAGAKTPSEAAAMRDYFAYQFPYVPQQAIMLEEASIDTASNAEEIIKLLSACPEKRYEHIGLLTVGYHMSRANNIFKSVGLPIEQSFISENIIVERGIDQNARGFVERWSQSRKVKVEKAKESIGRLILKADSDGRLLGQVKKRSRSTQ